MKALGKMKMYAIYSLGITGYELWNCPDAPGYLMVLYVGGQKEQIARRYKVHRTASGRQFVQPHGRRIYLDQCVTVK